MTKIFTAEGAENAEILGSKSNPSVTGVENKFCCGLGVRTVRAGSIGRDRQGLGENTDEYLLSSFIVRRVVEIRVQHLFPLKF